MIFNFNINVDPSLGFLCWYPKIFNYTQIALIIYQMDKARSTLSYDIIYLSIYLYKYMYILSIYLFTLYMYYVAIYLSNISKNLYFCLYNFLLFYVSTYVSISIYLSISIYAKETNPDTIDHTP